MINKEGFTALSLVLVVVIFLGFIGIFIKINLGEQNKPEDRINNYEECATRGGYVENSSIGVIAPNLNFVCHINGNTYVATVERCTLGQCEPIDAAFQNYCFKRSLDKEGGSTSTVQAVSYYYPVIIRDNFARGSVYCKETDKLEENKTSYLTVYLKYHDKAWREYLTVTDQLLCEEIDNKNIPLRISGTCFDPSNGWRIPIY